MNIGYFTNMSYQDTNNNIVPYVGGVIVLPFLEPLNVAMISTPKEQKAKNPNSPDFIVAAIKPKGYEGLRQIVGALWNKTSQSGKSYISGYIESPVFANGKIFITLFEGGENSKVLYNVVYSQPRTDKNTTSQEQMSSQTTDSDYSQDEIPF
ncbi:DUF736 family protein [Campylobacter gastrosuis]|uniref:DUF736 domain-containing protein n=1 Tax=Campylobacter gastrosuis TaxID=2974576 RepID=A0ABT7HPD4_9BACT|nr:DUF736 family protein [Campylobacter gastrosuis]MDL0088505.1 DUF736 domain-containing protein [Campylobacter gastrosuis]